LDGAIHGGAADREQLSQFGAGVLARVPELDEMSLLGRLELGRFATQPPLGLGNLLT